MLFALRVLSHTELWVSERMQKLQKYRITCNSSSFSLFLIFGEEIHQWLAHLVCRFHHQDFQHILRCIPLIQARKRELERLRKQLASATVLDSLGSPGDPIGCRYLCRYENDSNHERSWLIFFFGYVGWYSWKIKGFEPSQFMHPTYQWTKVLSGGAWCESVRGNPREFMWELLSRNKKRPLLFAFFFWGIYEGSTVIWVFPRIMVPPNHPF